MIVYFAIDRSFNASLGFEKLVKVQQQQNISWQNSPKTTMNRKVVEITSKHFFWKKKGPLKLCDLLREATNVTKLDWNNIVLRNKEQRTKNRIIHLPCSTSF